MLFSNQKKYGYVLFVCLFMLFKSCIKGYNPCVRFVAVCVSVCVCVFDVFSTEKNGSYKNGLFMSQFTSIQSD